MKYLAITLWLSIAAMSYTACAKSHEPKEEEIYDGGVYALCGTNLVCSDQ